MKSISLTLGLLLSANAWAAPKPCEELKAEIDAKLKAKGVAAYSLDILAADAQTDAKVVGSCEAGTKKLVYKKG